MVVVVVVWWGGVGVQMQAHVHVRMCSRVVGACITKSEKKYLRATGRLWSLNLSRRCTEPSSSRGSSSSRRT